MDSEAKNKSINACETCGKYFSKPTFLRRHLVVHNAEKPFRCDKCPCRFSQKSSLQRHGRVKHNTEESSKDSDVAKSALAALKLLQCSHTSTKNTSLNQEPIQPVWQKTQEEQASYDLVELRDKLNPKREVNLLLTQRILRPKPNRCFFVCEFCAKEFSKTYDLIRHRRSHTKETPYPCNRCAKRFPTQSKLSEHQRLYHNTSRKFRCDKCSAIFITKKKLHLHLREEHQNPIYSCTYCDRNFDTKDNFEAHVKLERDSQKSKLIQMLPEAEVFLRSYRCVYCKKEFKRKFNCRTHMLLHLRRLVDKKQTKNSCLHCGKYFKRSHDLSRHLLTHTKLKSHICQICQKGFSLQSTLNRHLRTHQVPRSTVSCQVCGKCYSSKTSLQLHLRLHTGERPFKCEVCGESFRTSGHKLEHMRAERHRETTASALIL